MTRNLYQAAHAALMLDDPAAKRRAAAELQARWAAGELLRETAPAAVPIEIPGRPARPVLVHPRDVPQRRLNSDEGRAALVHAIAHIEFNAINLALDAVYRFRDLPDAYYGDWLRVAAEEASHFALLQARLAELGHAYGDLPAHNGLWEMALKTAHDPLVRMALVPRVLEARGLDVTPGMMERLRQVGDTRTVAILEVILREEIGHVAIGSRWYAWCCAQRGVDPQATFLDLLDEYMTGRLRGPFHEEARRQAGFTEAELAKLNALDSN